MRDKAWGWVTGTTQAGMAGDEGQMWDHALATAMQRTSKWQRCDNNSSVQQKSALLTAVNEAGSELKSVCEHTSPAASASACMSGTQQAPAANATAATDRHPKHAGPRAAPSGALGN